MSQPGQQTLRPAEECVEALVVSGGNVHLAAERLFGTHPSATAWLMASIAQDPMAQSQLNAQLRTLTTLKTFDAFNTVVALLPTVIADMEPAEFTKLFGDILKHMTALTATTQAQQDPGDALTRLMQTLPPNARRALITLISNDAPGSNGHNGRPTEDATYARLSGGWSDESALLPEGFDGHSEPSDAEDAVGPGPVSPGRTDATAA